MKSKLLLPRSLTGSADVELRAALAACAGFRWEDDYRGRLDPSATVTLGVAGVVLLRAPLADTAGPRGDLERSGTLPGNLRIGDLDGGRGWFAELSVDDGTDVVAAGFAEFRAAIAGEESTARNGTGGSGPGRNGTAGNSTVGNSTGGDPSPAPALPPSTALPPSPALPSLAQLARDVLGDDGVVERPDGMELRPRLGDRVVPLVARVDGGGARLTRVVLRSLPESTADAVAHHARTLTADLRHCRLALDDGALVVETRTTLIPGAFARALRAVAAAYAHVHVPLKLLARNELVARCYEQAFCEPQPIGAE